MDLEEEQVKPWAGGGQKVFEFLLQTTNTQKSHITMRSATAGCDSWLSSLILIVLWEPLTGYLHIVDKCVGKEPAHLGAFLKQLAFWAVCLLK